MENHQARQTDRRVPTRTLGVATDAQTYKNLLYLVARFPLGIAYLTVFVTGLSLGVSLAPLLVGLPILAGVLAVAGYVGVVEATLLRTLLDRDVEWSPVDPNNTPVVPYLKQVATDPINYLLLVLAFASFGTGIGLFVALVVGFALSLSLVVAPAVYWREGVQYFDTTESIDLGVTTISQGQLAIETLPEALLASLIGIALTVAGLHLVNLTTRVYADVTEALLSGSE
ncbi:sensor domain-containing protein [Halovenus salina]|uniref:Sensor domain-containing protein n=1 Tax=Halovenus salina TaxID=1510225 RepID=A0ABD5W346_9EURY|nr:sensor domain-containing protein [Halovenus salina]